MSRTGGGIFPRHGKNRVCRGRRFRVANVIKPTIYRRASSYRDASRWRRSRSATIAPSPRNHRSNSPAFRNAKDLAVPFHPLVKLEATLICSAVSRVYVGLPTSYNSAKFRLSSRERDLSSDLNKCPCICGTADFVFASDVRSV